MNLTIIQTINLTIGLPLAMASMTSTQTSSHRDWARGWIISLSAILHSLDFADRVQDGGVIASVNSPERYGISPQSHAHLAFCRA